MMTISVHITRLKTLLAIILFVVTGVAKAQHPNVIYIMSDDMGYGDLSGYGRKDYQTPNLDKLASQGIKFTHAYSAAPLCTPTRAAFMTGRYPARTPVGLIEPLTPTKRDSLYGLTPEYPSLATMMKHAGYETALVGKWHLGFQPQHSPMKNGFDYFFGIHSGAADYISHKGDGRADDLYENDALVDHPGYMTDLFTEKAVAFIRKPHPKPFFLVLTFTAPHWPWQQPGDKPYPDSVNMRDGGSPEIFAAMMKSMDDGVGAIMKALDEKKLGNETIVIFTNDNGGERYSNNGGLKEGKTTLWEGGIRVPAFVRWTGKIKSGVITDQVAVTMDWTATILNAGGAKAEKNFPLDGINLMPVLLSKEKKIERTLYWRTIQQKKQQYAMRMGDWKYLKDNKGEYLFNLTNDQAEKQDLGTQHPDILSKMKTEYAKWESTVLKPVPY